jgi:hypothetical protein
VWTQTIGRWRMIERALDDSPVESILHLLLSMTALCRRSDALYCQSRGAATNRPTEPRQGHDPPEAQPSRCEFCPLFHQLGGKPEDVGCQSIVDPIIAAVRAGDRDTARAQAAAALRTLERMPAPEEAQPPA